MILYLDTSALVKLYVDEEHCDAVRTSVAESEAVATSLVAFVEARASFARLHRERRLDENAFGELKHALTTDWRRFAKIGIDESLVWRAGDLAEAFSLRGYDSVHLASAEYLQINSGAIVTFGCFDHRLSHAAAVLGMKLHRAIP